MTSRENKKQREVIEFRKDIVSDDWILVSSVRSKRPHLFNIKEKIKKKSSLKNCPFEDPQKSGNPMPVLWYPKVNAKNKENFKEWFVQIITNKYPLLLNKNTCPSFDLEGIHQRVDAYGFHEIVITRDHKKTIEKMSLGEIVVLLKAYRERYKTLEKNEYIDYILIFHNQGELAGASVEHPHSQIVALPIIPPDVNRSINGGMDFFKKHKKCVHCLIIEREIKEKKRIISKNNHFIVFNPYAPRVSFETRIFPLRHNSDFEETSDQELESLAEILKDTLARISKTLNSSDYNFFIHTSSARVDNVPYYHWHVEILPKTYKWAGMELGTGIEVVSVPPEQSAEQLRRALKNNFKK